MQGVGGISIGKYFLDTDGNVAALLEIFQCGGAIMLTSETLSTLIGREHRQNPPVAEGRGGMGGGGTYTTM